MIGMMDESIADTGTGCIYILTLVVADSEELELREDIRAVVDGRRRPFHWSEEGPQIRKRMSSVARRLPLTSYAFAAACGRSRQDATRDFLMRDALETAALSRVSRIHVESRSEHLDIRDRRVAHQVFADDPGMMPVLRWAGKDEPLTWLADALAGSMYELLLRPEQSRGAESLRQSCRCSGLTWHLRRQ